MLLENLLLLTDFFPPGYRSGGPARSCYNLSLGLSQLHPIKVLTRDTDLGAPLPYPNIQPDTWTDFASGVSVCYCSPKKQRFRSILRRMRDSKATVFYLNSMFSLPFTIYPLLAYWLGFIQGRVVLAPRGMLKASALQYKPLKKRLFLALFRGLGWHKRIIFQATNTEEAQDIQRVFGAAAQLQICPPVPELGLLRQRVEHIKAAAGVRLCMLGRIHPIKNIDLGLELLADLYPAPVLVDVIGPFEDAAYYTHCQAIAAALPDSIRVVFHGALPTVAARGILQQADFFYLLTQGENFGHAIFEALALGKPALISDQTPWRNLRARRIGWDLALDDLSGIRAALREAVDMDFGTYQDWSDAAHRHARELVAESDWEAGYLGLFGYRPPSE